MNIERARIGFEYKFECFDANGKLKWEFVENNIIPDQGRDYLLTAALLGGSQFTNWFIGLYEGAYMPQAHDTAATFPSAATEITLPYSEATRPALVFDPVSGGVLVNAANKAEFTFTQNKTVRGGFISSSGVKGGTTGVLLSAVMSPSPKSVDAGEQLRVTAGLALITV